MSAVTLSSKFQVVIPKELRRELGLKAGEKLDVHRTGNKIEITRVRGIMELYGTVPGPNDFKRDKDRQF